MTTKSHMIHELNSGEFIILDRSDKEYPDFPEIHHFGVYGSSFGKRRKELEELLNDGELKGSLMMEQLEDGTNYIYLYFKDDENEDDEIEYIPVKNKVVEYLKQL